MKMHKCLWISAVPLLLLVFCVDLPSDPSAIDSSSTAMAGLMAVYVNDGKTIYKQTSSSSEVLFVVGIGESITDFDIRNSDGALLVITDYCADWSNPSNDHTNKITRVLGDTAVVLYEKTTNSFMGEHLHRLRISPDGSAIAVEVYEYSYGGIAALLSGVDTLVYSRGEAGMDDMSIRFLVWHPEGNVFYARFAGALVECDAAAGTNRYMPSPNIRDYLSTEYLLSQGYLGERFDFGGAISKEEPSLVDWSPDGERFAYLSGDSILVYSLLSDSSAFICLVPDTGLPDRILEFEWASSQTSSIFDTTVFTENDRLAVFDSTVLDSILPLNPRIIEYTVSNSLSAISTVRMVIVESWASGLPVPTSRIIGRDSYTIRNSVEKAHFHLVESDFMVKLVGQLCNRHPYGNIDSTTGYLDSLLASYDQMISDADTFRVEFAACSLIQSFEHLRTGIDEKLGRTIRFHRILRETWASRDTASFIDSLYAVFPAADSTFVDSMSSLIHTIADTANLADALSRVLTPIHNNFLNVFRWQEVMEMRDSLIANGIERYAQ